MSKPAFRIKPYNHHPTLKFVVSSHISGKRERKFFETKKAAETHVQLREIELLNQGREGATFSTELRVLAQRADDLLRPFGKSVLDAAEYFAAHLRSVTGSKAVADVVTDLLARREKDGARPDYLNDLRTKFATFCKTFGTEQAAGVTPKAISDWLHSLNVGVVSRNTYRSRLATLFEFARQESYVTRNPVEDVARGKENGAATEILTVEQTAKLLSVASEETLPYFAIGAFAGLRSSELEKLTWENVHFDTKLIEVTAQSAKTGSRRLVTMQPNLRAWLKGYRKSRGPVCPVGLRKRLEADRELAGLQNWPRNVLRHSYCSFHLAEHKDAAALALEAGNSPRMIFRHYRQLVKPKDAKKFWSLKPSKAASKKIVQLAEAA